MFKEKYDIDPKHLAIWASIYLVTIIPCYEILFTRVPLFFVMIVIIENMVSMYVFEESILDELMTEMEGHKVFILLIISLLVALMMFISLFFRNMELFIVMCMIELTSFCLTRGLTMLRNFKKK